jgi:hypothetical protein
VGGLRRTSEARSISRTDEQRVKCRNAAPGRPAQAVMFRFPTGPTITPPLIEIEHPAKPRTASYATGHLDHEWARYEAIVESLVIPFCVIVLDVLRHGPPEMRLTDRISRSRHSSLIVRTKRSA